MQYFIGLMSGTSSDAIDAALVSFTDNEINLESYQEQPYPSQLKDQITKMRSADTRFSLQEIAELDIRLGEMFADSVRQLLLSSNIGQKQILAIGSHGQTIFHSPDSSPAFTMQLGDPNTISTITGIKTVADFRRMDIAVGGQGAPLAPAFHNAVFRDQNKNRIILNLGGIANITLLPASSDENILGFDTGPANALMDDWIKKNLDESYDQDGQWGKSGQVISDLLSIMLDDNYFQIPAPKSTGREYFNLQWLNQKINSKIYRPEDIQATLQHLTVRTIANSIQQLQIKPDEVIICGGGVHNKHIVSLLSKTLGDVPVLSTADLGIDPNCVEAMAFAWLAKQRLDNLPGNIPSVTGAKKEVLLGGVYG